MGRHDVSFVLFGWAVCLQWQYRRAMGDIRHVGCSVTWGRVT